MNANVLEKLKILAESAKYDVSCASSGTVRANKPGTLGNTVGGWGICHSFAEDGRCISLLKVMLTNYCIYDCAYCINRRSNDLPRATLSVSELVDLTIEFYRRNYIEGLFLSSGVVRNPDYTMERLVRVAKDLREVHRFNGYIHLKSIPGASRELVNEAGRYADRLSVNVEIPKEENLKLLAPEKDHKSVFAPMLYIQQGVLESSEERKKFRYAPRFAPAGQSTQMIVGATAESDKDILFLSSALYQRPTMKRVYYSGYVSVNTYDTRLPALKQPPLVRENRLYQADWLMRFYQFKVNEIVDDTYPDLDLEIDPKLSWALRHPEQFPVDINKADYEMILRIPGIGVKSAKLIIASRRYSKLGYYQLKKIGVVMKKAQYFITCSELPMRTVNEMTPQTVRSLLLPKSAKKKTDENQLSLFLTIEIVMILFIYDKTLDGLLTALFDAYNRKTFPDVLLSKGDTLPLFYDDIFTVITDEEKAGRVWRGLQKKISASALSAITWCWLSELSEVGMLLFRYIRKAIDSPVSIETNFGDPDVLALSKIWKRVDWERLRMLQFVRFQKAVDGTFFAAFEPQHNALPLTVGHFKDRFADQRWLIYDMKRRYGFYYDLHTVEEVTFDDDGQAAHLITGMLDESLMDKDEKLFQQLWKTYFKSITIKERLNPRKHKQDMPVRYWKYITEKQK